MKGRTLNKSAMEQAISQHSYDTGNGTMGRKTFSRHFLPEVMRRQIIINEKEDEGKYSYILNPDFSPNT